MPDNLMDSICCNVTSCARCGDSHASIEFHPFKTPESEWTHWAICPVEHQPILMMQVKGVSPGPGKVSFPSGAERGTQATRGWYMLSQIALRRYADAMTEGATKYKPYNWLKGIPVTNQIEHLYTHLASFLQGDSTEDHLGHALWNLAAIIHYSETRHDLFEGLPPGCREGMLEWLATYRVFSSREETPDCVRSSGYPSNPDSGGESPSSIRSFESDELKTQACEMTAHIDRLKKALDEANRWRHVLKRESDEAKIKAGALEIELQRRAKAWTANNETIKELLAIELRQIETIEGLRNQLDK